jgi:thymidylate synthase (FAD)
MFLKIGVCVMEIFKDPYLTVKTIGRTENPETLIYTALRQDYSSEFVGDKYLNCDNLAPKIIKALLAGKKGHFGPLEHPSITLAVGYFPHDVMVQARTHRIGVSFDVMSQRYTSENLIKAAKGELPLEKVVYVRPIGFYPDPNDGHIYEFCEKERARDLEMARIQVNHYAESVATGMPFEMARHLAPQGVRQHFVVSFNLRSLFHFLDLRAKHDAQIEIRTLAHALLSEARDWCPELTAWYEQNRLEKGLLAP